MEFSGRYYIAAPPQQVWDSLNDPEILRACLPGCERLARVGAYEFQVSATIKTGFMKAKFHGNFAQSEIDPPGRCLLHGEAQGGAAGSVKAEARITLDSDGENTVLNYMARAAVEGKMAQMSQRTILSMASQIADELFARLQVILAEKNGPVLQPNQPAKLVTAPTASAQAAAPEIWVVGLIGVVLIILVLFGLTL